MNPYYEQFKGECLMGEGFNRQEIGPFYKGVLFQRGYGLSYQELPICQMYGLGLGDTLSHWFQLALPMIKRGLKFLGKKAVNTAANIAQDAIEGRKFQESAKEHVTETAKDIWTKAPAAIRENEYKGSGNEFDFISLNPAGKRKRTTKKSKPNKRYFGRDLLSTYPLLNQL